MHALIGAIVAGATLSHAVAIPAIRDVEPMDPEPVPSEYLFLEFQQRLDEAVWNLRSRVDASTIQPYDFQWVGFLITEWGNRAEVEFPGACEIRRRLQAEVDDLTERATKGFLQMEDIAALHERVIDARLDMAIHELRVATTTQASRNPEEEPVTSVEESSAEVVRLIYERAEAAQGDANAQVVRDRLAQKLDELHKSAYETVDFLRELRVELVTSRFLRAKMLLEEHAARMGLTRRDYDRVIELWLDRARAIADEPYPTCQ